MGIHACLPSLFLFFSEECHVGDIVAGAISDLSRSRTDLLVENAMLRWQRIVLNSQIALARGARTGIFNALMPVLWATFANNRLYLLSRSRMRYFGPFPHGVASHSCCAVL
jgi:hypothetical protein